VRVILCQHRQRWALDSFETKSINVVPDCGIVANMLCDTWQDRQLGVQRRLAGAQDTQNTQNWSIWRPAPPLTTRLATGSDSAI
jgi:hypothetical protein